MNKLSFNTFSNSKTVLNLYFRNFASKSRKMGVTKEIIKEGDGTSYPTKGQTVTVHYTGKITNKIF